VSRPPVAAGDANTLRPPPLLLRPGASATAAAAGADSQFGD